MKKFFTLLTLLLTIVGGANSVWASDYEWSDDGQKTTLSATAAKGSSSASHYSSYSISYGGTTYTQAVKMESATTITFTTSATATITIGITTKNNTAYSDATKATVKFDNVTTASALDAAQAKADGTYSWKGVTIENVAAGSHTISRGDSEVGVFYIKVHETGSVMTKLSTPEITYVPSTGTVTIGAVANATKVTYTTDGTDPTASSDTYSAPFVVDDGTVVKAIAIGGGSYSNSDVASETVYKSGITATPTFKKFNGAVAITSATPDAIIKFSTNNGITYDTYTRPFTLSADATIKAYAERMNCTTSAVASEDVNVLASNKTKTIYLDFDDFDISSYTATGKTSTVADGYTLTISNTGKSWTSNNVKITTPAGIKREFKLSNGAQNTLTIPEGVHVTKLTLYSFINSTDKSYICGWKEVGGVDYVSEDIDYRNVPMGSYTDVDEYNTRPDVRVYNIDQTGGTITFNNGGQQLSFVIALDILEATTTITPAKEYSTYVTPAALDFSGLELKAYVATAASSTVVTMTPVTTVPAGTPLLLKKGSAASYNVPVAASASAPASNLLKISNGVSTIGGDGVYDYILSNGQFYHASAGVLPAGKCYVHLDSAPAGARELTMSFEDETTGIQSIENGKLTIDNSVYDLQGRKVAQPTKGLYIVNGKKVVIK